MELQEQLYENLLYKNDLDLVRNLWLISKSGKTIRSVEPIAIQRLVDVATVANFDIFPALTGSLYFIKIAGYSKYGITGVGVPLIDFYDPFTGLVTYKYGGSSLPNNTLTVNIGFPGFMLASRVLWNDNAATVGTYSVFCSGYKINFSTP